MLGPMHIGLIGPGAIGTVLAAALVERPGTELVIGARAGFERIVLGGLAQPIDAPARVLVDAPAAPAAMDVVVVATKAHQTEGARAWLEAWIGPATIVLVAQNGVEHVERIHAIVPAARVVPAIVAFPAHRTAPGRAVLGGAAILTVPDGEPGQRIADLFAGSHVVVRLTDDWITVAWRKLLFNAAVGAITTLARRSIAVLGDPEARALAVATMHEAAAVARAEGADLSAEAVDAILDPDIGRADHLSSITRDRLAGLATEWQARNEVIVRKAAQHGIAVPLNRALTTLLRVSEPG
jgi:2-dehydropantoate 2-reductase